jgi:hypothetical protein
MTIRAFDPVNIQYSLGQMHGLSSARHTKDEAGERSASQRIIVHPIASDCATGKKEA